MKILRKCRRPVGSFLCVLTAFWQIAQPLQGADFYWDTDGSIVTNNANTGDGLGGTGTWDIATMNWWPVPSGALTTWGNSSADHAIFSGAYDPTGIPTLNSVNISGAITANKLSFLRSGYTLSGGTSLTLAGGGAGLHSLLGESATIDSIIGGTAGLQKTGGGSIRLGNFGNTYTGVTTISNGTLIISDSGALGTDSSAISILSNNNTPLNNNLLGFTGGSLVLDGTSAGFTFARDVNFEGRGPIGDRGAAILSLGNNTLSGTLTSAVSPLPLSPTASIRNSRINSVNGVLNLSGTVNAGGASATTFINMGGVNSAGAGDFAITGVLAGTGSIEKSGAGTLFLNPSSTSGFGGTIRVSGSATGQQSSVRVTQATVGGTSIFGTNIGTTTAAAIDLNGGVLEFRNEGDLNFGALATGKNAYNRAGSSIYTGPAVGGSGINGTTTLGALQHIVSTTGSTATTTFNSRNGYGVTFSAMATDASTSTSTLTNTLTNNMGGNLTFTGSITLAEGNTASRPRVLAVGGAGNTVILGSVVAGTDPGKTLTKSGAGSLTIAGVGTTVAGTISISAGAIIATDFRSLNNNTAAISLGNATTTGGNLIIGGTGVTPTLAGLTTSKTITLNTTTGANSIYANQTGAIPVTLNGAITKIAAATTGALILGGTNTVDNIINAVIPVEPTPSTGGVTKIGAGTWVLNAANTYAGATTIQNGTLKLRATAAASDVIKSAASNTIVFSANATTGTAGGTLEFRGFSGVPTSETLGALTPTGGAAIVRLLGNGGSAANLSFTSLGATAAASSVNFDTSGAIGGVVTLTGQAATTATNLPGTANFQGHLYINGADFATINGSAQVVAPTYAGAGDFQNAVSALAATVHNKLTGSFANAAATVSSLVTNNQTLTMSGNLTVSTGGILQSGGTASLLSDSGTSREIRGGVAATNVAFRVDGAGDVLNVGSATNPMHLGSFTTGGLTKNGAGTLVFFGTNAQTGTTNINEGTVSLEGASSRLSATSASLVIRQGATLQLNGASSANVVFNALDGAGTITNADSAAATFTQTGSGTWAGIFQDGAGVLNVTKGGTTGAPTWSGLNTYTGVTTIGGTTGLVTVNTLADGGVPSGIGASSSDAANLVFSGTSSGLIYAGNILEGALTLGSRSASTDRLFTLSGSGATLSSTASNNNAIVWSNTGVIVHGNDANRTLTLTGTSTGDNTFNPQLTDSTGFVTSLSKTSTGQWNLGNNNNTYTGVTAVSNGILALNHNGALPTNSPLTLGTTTTAGIIQMSGIFARNLATTPTAGSGTVTWAGTTGGGGFAAHSTPLTVTLDGGAGLTWGSGGFVGTGGIQALIFNSASALSDVTFTNSIELGTAVRTITVNDNGNTGADYVTMTGVFSSGAAGGLLKNGAGVLRLTAANTYTGTTAVEAGTLVVTSLGSSTGAGTTSVGAGGVTMDNTNAIVLGNATTTGGILQYVGPGETSDRKIRLRGTTAGNQIHADGAGPLILTNVAHDTTETGNKTLSLRGSNAAGNMITSQLSDNGAGVLSIGVDGGATWILTNGANNYTGTTTVGAGALGIGHDTAIGAALTISNGNVFAYGADRTLNNTLNLGNNATSGFIGDYSLTFNGTNNFAAGANNLNVYNSIVSGKALTMNGLLANSLTATRAWALDGPGETVVNGAFTTTTGFGVNINKTGNGILTLGTNGSSSNWNQANNIIDIDRGTLKFTANDAIPTTFGAAAATTSATVPISTTTYTVDSTAGLVVGQTFTGTNVPAGSQILTIDSPTTFTATIAPTTAVASGAALAFAASGGLTLSPELATTDTVTVDLNGTTQTVNALTAITDGSVVIDNTSATAASFRFGANNSAVNFGSGAGNYTITDSGAGALSIVKLGNTSATFNSGMTLTYQGATRVEGGSLTIGSPVNGTSALQVINSGSTLTLSGGITNPNAVTTIVVENGGTLNLTDGAGSQFANLANLTLGSSGGAMTTLGLNVGDSLVAGDELNTDLLSLMAAGTLNLFAGNKVTLNLTDAGLNASQTYDLLTFSPGGFTSGPLSVGDWLLGATPGGFSSIVLTVNNDRIFITTGTLITGDSYWNGTSNTTWNVGVGNWSQNKLGTTPALSIPGQGTDVIFQSDAATSGAVVTTLEQNFKINSLTFEAATVPANTPTSIAINPGTVVTNRLEIAPQLPADGITIASGGTPSVTISAPLRLGSNQTWNVADAASTLTLSGGLQGEKDVTKSGAGKVILSAAADSSFNAGLTTDFTVSGGNFEFTNIGALGTVANSNLANVIISGGGFYYNNATAGTVANNLTLSGGTLSVGGTGHNYSGTLNVSADSFINLRDSNSATTTTTQRDITLSGPISGSGDLTLDSIDTVGVGNQITGNLIITNAGNSGWSGDLNILRGSVIARGGNADTLGSGDVNFEFGKVEWEGAGGAIYNLSNNITIARAGGNAVGEWNIDRTSGTGAFTVNNSGTVTLGGAGGTGELRIFLADADGSAANFTGPVLLANDASISVRDSATLAIATFSGIISESGGSRSLIVNGPVGGGADWGGTDGILRLTGLNTFTGNVSLAGGTLEFDTITNISGGASALGNGTAINMAGGTLRFIGTAAQSTDRPIATTASATLSANGDEVADTITYNGAITQALDNSFVLSGAAAREGYITGGITQSGAAADLTVNGGTWTLSGATSTIADDVVITGTTAILNLNTAGVIAFGASTGNLLQIINGATVNLGASGTMTGTVDAGIYLAQSAGGAEAILNMNGFNQTFLRLILGERLADRSGTINGSGTLTIDGATGIELYRGTINANLASTAATPFNKYGPGIVTLKGDNSGILTTTAAIVNEGTLVLDYTANNATKLRAASALDMRGADLSLIGNNGAATSQNVLSFTLGSGGSNVITLNPGTGQDIVLNLNAITRAANSQDGTIRFNLPTGTQSATNGITTDSLNTIGTGANAILGGWATVTDDTGTFFARNVTNTANGNLGIATTTSQDTVASWLAGENISDATGFTGALGQEFTLNSLRFNAASGSDLALGSAGHLRLTSGGILVTSAVGGTPSISGGTIETGRFTLPVAALAEPELIITQDSASVFEIGSSIHLNNSVVKSGSGTLLLSGNNSYIGYTEIQNGTLQVGGGNAIGDTSLVTLSSSRNSILQLLSDETIGRLQGGRRNDNSDYGMVDVGAFTLSINESASTTYSGRFTGSGNIVLASGTGNLNYNGQTSTGLFTGSVIVNSALFQISGASARLGSASSFTISGGGNFLIDNNDDNAPNDRISDTAGFTLNSAAGAFSGNTQPRGLAIRTDNNGNESETIGDIAFASGANYAALEASGGTSAVASIISSNWIRQNNATVNVRGRNLGGTANERAQFKVADASDAAMIAANIGGGGVIGGTAKNVSIIPWAIGQSISAALAVTDMGNTFLSYVDNRGFVPLSLTNEFSTFGTAAAGDNVRESLTTDLTAIAGATVNSLILHNDSTAASTVNVTGSGPGQVLANASGAFLFTLNTSATASSAHNIALGGFDDGIETASSEYVFHVVNPSSAATTATLTATISSGLDSTADITKSGRGTLILTALNVAGGGTKKTTLNEGTLQIADLDNIGGNTGGLGFAGGSLRLDTGFTDDLSTRTVTFFAGGATLDTNGNNIVLANSIGGGGAGSFTKIGTGDVTLNAASSYSGATTFTNGILTLGVNNALPSGTNLTLGAATTAATLDLNGFNQTIGSFTVPTNSSSLTTSLVIDPGNTFTANGNVFIGANAAATTTLFSATGGGSFVVNSPAGTFQLGAGTGGTNTNVVTADFSALANFNVNLGPTGIFRIGDNNTNSGGGATATTTLTLAGTSNTITTGILGIGDAMGQSATGTLELGGGTNVINADTLYIGASSPSSRSSGNLVFDGVGGSLTLRGSSGGTSRADVAMTTSTFSTGAIQTNTFLTAGHSADLRIDSFVMSERTASTGSVTSTFTFDTGTADITNLVMSRRSGAGTGDSTAIVTLGGGTTTIGSIDMAASTGSGAGSDAFATLNISGVGTVVNIGDGLNTGTAINMANAGSGRTATSDINLTGGTVTLTGNVIRTGGAGTESGTLTLNGAALNMSGNSIGTVGATINFAAASGTLTNLAQLNGGGVLDKTTAGILSLGNGNTYTGGTTVSAGTLLATNTTGSATGSGAVATLATTLLGGTGIIAPGSGAAVTVDGTLRVGGASPVAGQTLTIATNAAALTINNLLTFDLFSGEGSGVLNGLADADRLLLTGNSSGATAVLGASSVFEITTTVAAGWTANSSWQLIDWAGLAPTGTFSNLTSTIGNFANLPNLSTFGLAWDVSAIYSTGVVSIAVIPEPSRAMLLLLGLLGLFFRRRRD